MTILFDDGGSVNTEDGICRGRRDSSEDYHEGEGRCKSTIASHGPMTRTIWMRDTIVQARNAMISCLGQVVVVVVCHMNRDEYLF